LATGIQNQERLVQIIEDDQCSRELLMSLFETLDFDCRSYESAEQFLESNAHAPIGCLVLDLDLRGQSGLDLLKTIRNRGWTIPTLIVSGTASVSDTKAAIKYGVLDVMEKPIEAQKLLSLVEVALSIQPECSDTPNNVQLLERLSALSDTARDVLHLMLSGKQNKSIACELDIGLRSVVRHRKRIHEKLEIASFPELVRAVTLAGVAEEKRDLYSSFSRPFPQRIRHELRNKLNAIVLALQLYKLQLEHGQFSEAPITCERIERGLQELVDKSRQYSPAQMALDASCLPVVLLLFQCRQESALLAGIMKLNEFFPEPCFSLEDAVETIHADDEPPAFVLVELDQDSSESIALIEFLKSSSETRRTAVFAFSNSPLKSFPKELCEKIDCFFQRPVDPVLLNNSMIDRMVLDQSLRCVD